MVGSCKVLQNLTSIRLEINDLITLLVFILVSISLGVFFNFLLSKLPELYLVLDRGRERAQLFCLGHKGCICVCSLRNAPIHTNKEAPLAVGIPRYCLNSG